MDRLNNKVALVTGASTGIGKAIVTEMVRKGMKVCAMALHLDKIKMYADELKDLPGKMYPMKCDLTKKDEIVESMKWIEKNMGAIDVLVNNAGIDMSVKFMTGEMEDWEKIFDVNLMGMVWMTKEFLMMKKKLGTMETGHIFNINDFRCFTRLMNKDRMTMMSAPYMASKLAMKGVEDSLRMELDEMDSKMKITNISPGLVNTEMTMKLIKERGLRVFLEPRDVAECLMLAMTVRDTVLIRDMVVVPVQELY